MIRRAVNGDLTRIEGQKIEGQEIEEEQMKKRRPAMR